MIFPKKSVYFFARKEIIVTFAPNIVTMPEISKFYGIVITMYFPEHNPPHFHVRYNEYRASIDIQTGKVTGEMPRRALKLVYDWLDLHKEELLENWYKLEKGNSPSKIKPLE